MDSRQSRWLSKISQATGNQGIHSPGEGASEDAGIFVASTENTKYSVQGYVEPPIRGLEGEVNRLEERPFTGGTYCEVWVGEWVK